MPAATSSASWRISVSMPEAMLAIRLPWDELNYVPLPASAKNIGVKSSLCAAAALMLPVASRQRDARERVRLCGGRIGTGSEVTTSYQLCSCID